MRTFLTILGFLAWLVSLMALVNGFTKGTDIQLIVAGVFGTMGAVCFGFVATLAKLEDPRNETATDLARELLEKWSSMEQPARDRLARSLIVKIDTAVSESDLTALEGTELRNRLTSLLSNRA